MDPDYLDALVDKADEMRKREKEERLRDRTPWPQQLMHGDTCAWRFGARAECDCGLEERRGR